MDRNSATSANIWAVLLVTLAGLGGAIAAWKPADLYFHKDRAFPIRTGLDESLSEEEVAAIRSREQLARYLAPGIFVAIGSGAICGAIGLAAGIAERKFGRALAGLFGGISIGIVAGLVGGAAGKYLSDRFRIMPILTTAEKLTRAYAFQSLAFVLFALAAVTIFLLVRSRASHRFRVWFGAVLAGLVAPPVYMAAASILSPLASTENFIPMDPTCRLLWFATPAVLISLAVSLLYSRSLPADEMPATA